MQRSMSEGRGVVAFLVVVCLAACGPRGAGTPAPPAANGDPLIVSLAQTNAKVEQFQFSPDGRQIVYVSAKNGEYDLWVMAADGTGAHPITAGNHVYQAFDGPTITPEWSPDGQWISYVSRGEIHLVRPDGSAPPTNISYGQGGLKPLWTADSRWLISTPGGESVGAFGQIIRLRADIPSGPVDATRLTDEPFGHGDPRPSPDGRLVAFTSNRPATPGAARQNGVWVMPVDGGIPRLVAANVSSPRWSPDGRRLLVTSVQPSGWRNIGIVDVASGGLTMITESSWDEGNPQWSPDGQWVAYVANQRWNLHLMKVRASGGTPQALTTAPGVNGGWGRPARCAERFAGRPTAAPSSTHTWTLRPAAICGAFLPRVARRDG